MCARCGRRGPLWLRAAACVESGPNVGAATKRSDHRGAVGDGYVTAKTMVREGFWLNLVGVAVITLVCYFLLPF